MTNNQLTDEQIAQWMSAACMVIGDRFATVDELSAANAIRSLAVELQERRKAAMDSEPVAHQPELANYLPAQPAPNFKKLARELVENLVDCGGLDVGVKGKYLKWTEKTCRAAMLAAAPQEVK
ncbi:hypothetical protein [Klebsiella pneumoniae]|uniref:hypothetical protein n=1 Tax=Klebsiella pneumoniae TaxID=573 RepID=UPI002730FA0C|nr:hypothetical protein [Klebsiella pneumoniae]MDP0689795.1 hypothetical protein [Klebsiella pneumoniae]MDP0770302.1 hypothetical protein [Klebsiella pneumoniae]